MVKEHKANSPYSALASGSVPGLFTPEEEDKELQLLRDSLPSDPAAAGFTSVHDYFAARVMRNLHVVLLLDPDGEDLRSYGEAIPALLDACDVVVLPPP